METQVEVLEGDRAKVTVTVDDAAVAACMKKQYRDFAGRYNFPGFRRGKAPRPVVDSMLGKNAVPASVTDELVNGTCGKALDESGLRPVGEPQFDEDMGLAKDGQAFSYSFTIAVKPTFELASYDPVSVSLPAEGASDAEVDAEISSMLEHYSEVADAPANTKIKEENLADLSIKAADDAGADISSISTDSMQYAIGSGLFSDEFDQALLGLKKGDAKQFAIDVPAEPTAMTSGLAGKTKQIHFDVTVLVVKKRQQPKLTDEWVKEKIGLDDAASLRKEIADQIAQQKDAVLPTLKENRALAVLSERLEGEVPESLIEDQEQELLQDFFRQMQQQGMTLDAYLKQRGITSQQFRDDIKAQAAVMAKQNLALDAWAAHDGIEATDADVTAEFARSGAGDPAALEKEWREGGRLHLIREGIVRQKALDAVLAGAQVVEESAEGAPDASAEPAKAQPQKAKKSAGKKAEAAKKKAETGSQGEGEAALDATVKRAKHAKPASADKAAASEKAE